MYVWSFFFSFLNESFTSHGVGIVVMFCLCMPTRKTSLFLKCPVLVGGINLVYLLRSRHPRCIRNLETHVAYLGTNGSAQYINSSCIMGWHMFSLCSHPHVGLLSNKVTMVRIIVMVWVRHKAFDEKYLRKISL